MSPGARPALAAASVRTLEPDRGGWLRSRLKWRRVPGAGPRSPFPLSFLRLEVSGASQRAAGGGGAALGETLSAARGGLRARLAAGLAPGASAQPRPRTGEGGALWGARGPSGTCPSTGGPRRAPSRKPPPLLGGGPAEVCGSVGWPGSPPTAGARGAEGRAVPASSLPPLARDGGSGGRWQKPAGSRFVLCKRMLMAGPAMR